MSNKTSDKNVSNIEIVIEDCREHLKLYGEAFITANELDRIEYILSDYTRQKQINEEHKKINGELREREKELEEESKENKKKYLALLIGQFPDTTETYKKYKEELQELLGGESK